MKIILLATLLSCVSGMAGVGLLYTLQLTEHIGVLCPAR